MVTKEAVLCICRVTDAAETTIHLVFFDRIGTKQNTARDQMRRIYSQKAYKELYVEILMMICTALPSVLQYAT